MNRARLTCWLSMPPTGFQCKFFFTCNLPPSSLLLHKRRRAGAGAFPARESEMFFGRRLATFGGWNSSCTQADDQVSEFLFTLLNRLLSSHIIIIICCVSPFDFPHVNICLLFSRKVTEIFRGREGGGGIKKNEFTHGMTNRVLHSWPVLISP